MLNEFWWSKLHSKCGGYKNIKAYATLFDKFSKNSASTLIAKILTLLNKDGASSLDCGFMNNTGDAIVTLGSLLDKLSAKELRKSFPAILRGQFKDSSSGLYIALEGGVVVQQLRTPQ